jgi:arsenate reductase
MSDYKLIHNPKCSKSRQTLELLKSKGIEPQILLYLEKNLDESFLKEVFKALPNPPAKYLRVKEDDYKNLENKPETLAEVIAAIKKYPKILERPILYHKGHARVGRPPENVLEII